MCKIYLTLMVAFLSAAGPAARAEDNTTDARKQQVIKTEQTFADTMKDRDLEKFSTFIAPDAVFFSRTGPLRGRANVVAEWQKLFVEKEPPFSWKPEVVEVLESGDLALSSGPVFGKDGTQIATFTSVWRLDRDGNWKIVFDKGGPPSK